MSYAGLLPSDIGLYAREAVRFNGNQRRYRTPVLLGDERDDFIGVPAIYRANMACQNAFYPSMQIP